jgi:regulator of RNase E activity RraB
MTLAEARKLINELRKQGANDEMAFETFFEMYRKDKLTLEQFEVFAGLLGYELTEEFKNMSEEERKALNVFEE